MKLRNLKVKPEQFDNMQILKFFEKKIPKEKKYCDEVLNFTVKGLISLLHKGVNK